MEFSGVLRNAGNSWPFCLPGARHYQFSCFCYCRCLRTGCKQMSTAERQMKFGVHAQVSFLRLEHITVPAHSRSLRHNSGIAFQGRAAIVLLEPPLFGNVRTRISCAAVRARRLPRSSSSARATSERAIQACCQYVLSDNEIKGAKIMTLV